jgi:hypothetical protein
MDTVTRTAAEAPERATELNIQPEEEDTQRRRAFVAAGLGWGLDGFDWTMFAYALPAITAALSLSPSDGPFIVACSLVPRPSEGSPAARSPTASAACACSLS